MQGGWLAVAVAALSIAAGCVVPAADLAPSASPRADVDFSDLAGADGTVLAGGVVELLFEGVTKVGVSGPLGVNRGPQDPVLEETFEVDARVGFVEANVTLPREQGGLVAQIRDEQGRLQCGAVSYLRQTTCNVPVPANATGKLTWTLRVVSASQASMLPVFTPVRVGAGGNPFEVRVSLHPPSHMTIGDPLAGVDPTLQFRISDTGVPGSEDLIGVLGDGTIFTQRETATMRSTDDGETWQNVGPLTTSITTLDPMLHVDPRRGLVYVDQLYVGCSILAWSADAGDSWITNPAACGAPANDHQKTASGANPIPGAPFPAVYYAYSSFARGIWVSRSLDGGVTWTTHPVAEVMPDDTRNMRNTGPVRADEKGNVYVPYYNCDGDGYISVGVSNDFGATWRVEKVADEPASCSDVDPGIAIDEDGTAYVAYHRPGGVRYVWTSDGGKTWSEPVTLSAPSQTAFVHVAAAAGAPGRLAVAWRATSDSAKDSTFVDGWAAWHLYVAVVEDATSDAPIVRMGIASAPDDPVQRGAICMNGVACQGGTRNLLDFIDMAAGPNGKVYVAYQDGCDGACATPADSRARLGPVAILDAGFSLYPEPPSWAT